MVGENRAVPKDTIEGLVIFRGETNQGPQAFGIKIKMAEQMIFHFGKDFGRVEDRKYVEDVGHSNFQVHLGWY